MKLSAPKQTTWVLAVIIGGLGILSHFVAMTTISTYSFWLVVIGFVLLVLGTLYRRF